MGGRQLPAGAAGGYQLRLSPSGGAKHTEHIPKLLHRELPKHPQGRFHGSHCRPRDASVPPPYAEGACFIGAG